MGKQEMKVKKKKIIGLRINGELKQLWTFSIYKMPIKFTSK